MTTGTLYGVGTGPGDPQLVTRRAWSLVESAQVIAYPAPRFRRELCPLDCG